MNWIILAVLTAFCFGLYNFFIKVASGSINQIAGAVILQIVAALVGGILLIYMKLSNQVLDVTSKGIYYSVLAGIAVGLAEILTFIVFSKNIPASVGTPIIIGGSILITALLGIFFLKESLSFIQYVAVFMIIAGVGILSMGVKH